jgi:HxlR-like helix-turn-helix
MLARRLSALVDAGLLQRRRYSQRPLRYEYILTEKGRDFRPVLIAMTARGNRHFVPEGASVLLVDKKTHRIADPVLVDRRTGRTVNKRELIVSALASDCTTFILYLICGTRRLGSAPRHHRLASLQFIIYAATLLDWNPNRFLALIISATVGGTISCHETSPLWIRAKTSVV